MEGKKISFGFKKVKKAEKPVVEEQKDFIECVEEKSIKVVGGEKATEKEPLIIPMKPNTLITAEKLKQIAAKVESSLDEPMEQKESKVDIKIEPVENETLDQMAVRELLLEAKEEVKVETQALTVPIPAKPVIDGQKESTLDDYEAVPIQDFGLAMLRGMGWTPDQEKANKYKHPQLRPKGLGLGADKVISDKQKKKTVNKDGKEEELVIVKNSNVKIVAGKHSGYYGKVVSLDEENGRVMVEITVKKETVSLSEFMMQPVTRAEFDKESKVINTDAYEEYKKHEQSYNQKSSRNSPQVRNVSRKDSPKVSDREASSNRQDESSKVIENRRRDESSNGKDRRPERRDSASSEHRNKKRDRYKRDSSASERDDRKTERARRDEEDRRTENSEDRYNTKKDKSKRNSSEERSRRKNQEKSRRDSSESGDRGSRKSKHKSKSDASENRESKTQKEKSRKDSSEEERSRKKKERDRKRYSSNDSVSSLSETEKKKKHKKHKTCRRQKDSSDSESDPPKKDRRDIDKKRKGKKKKRDRDRSPNYKKHRK